MEETAAWLVRATERSEPGRAVRRTEAMEFLKGC